MTTETLYLSRRDVEPLRNCSGGAGRISRQKQSGQGKDDALEGSIAAGGLRESGGRLVYAGSSLRVYAGELGMLMLRLYTTGTVSTHSFARTPRPTKQERKNTYIERSYDAVLAGVSPEARRRQASWHSWMISVAYFLFFASPEKAKLFSGLPSGIL